MQLVNETKHVRNMLYYVTTNNLLEFVIRKWIGKGSEIVNHISVAGDVFIRYQSGHFLLLC